MCCDVCNDAICFTCSSCSINTDERIHAYCQNNVIHIEDTKIKSSQLIVDNSNYYKENQFNDEIKYSLIKLSNIY
jgi:hypothetical protein